MAAVVLSSIQAGVGKTTVAAGIDAALRLHGCRVHRFCVGPGLAVQPPPFSAPVQLPAGPTGLDGWLLTEDAVHACFHSMASTADISLVEGCLGMFDSPTADGSEQGSTAQLAAWLQAPVVLVIDAQAFNTPRSILALVRGYAAGDGSCSIAGVILNKTAKTGLAAETQDALKQAGLDVAVLGSLPQVAQRRSSSDAGQEHSNTPSQAEQLVQVVTENINLQLLRQLAATAAVPQPQSPLPTAARTFRVSMGVACDEAFYSYFKQNLHMLQLSGVQLVPFSPLHDMQLPPGLSAVLLGGGAVAEHAAQLSANTPMLEALRAFAKAGGLVVGEAAGLMFLSQSLQQQQHGQRYAMVGLLPFHTQAQARQGNQGSYVTVTVKQQAQHPLLMPGSTMRGLATCCCHVLEERPVDSLAAALAGSSVQAAQQQQAAAAEQAGAASATESCTTDAPGMATADTSGKKQQLGVGPTRYTYSYSCTPLSSETKAEVTAASVVDEGYTSGTVLASAVQVHYGSCPELPQHIAQRCLRVDVATVTAAAAAASKQAAAAALLPIVPCLSTAHQPEGAVMLPDSPKDCSGQQQASFRVPSPGSRALSAPNLQEMVWHLQDAAKGVPAPPAAVPAAAGADGTSDVWQCPAGRAASELSGAAAGGVAVGSLSPARKSSSVPGGMWQMASGEHQQLMPYARLQQQLQQPLGVRAGSCPSGVHALLQNHQGMLQGPASDNGHSGQQGLNRWAAPAFNVPKRWSMELQRLGSSLTSQLLPGGYRSEAPSPNATQSQQQQQQQQQQQRGHSRSTSRSMMHLPEEAPLSEAAIRILDSNLPTLLGRTHHTHIGVAVPISGSFAGAAGAGGSTGSGASSVGGVRVHPVAGAPDSMSRSSSVHEQMSSLAASLAQQEAAGRANSIVAGPGSFTDEEPVMTACTEPTRRCRAVLEQHQHQFGGGAYEYTAFNANMRQRLSLDHAAFHQQPEHMGCSSSRFSLDTLAAYTTPAAAEDSACMGLAKQQQQQPAILSEATKGQESGLQPEVSLKAGLGLGNQVVTAAGGMVSTAAAAAATVTMAPGLTLPPKKGGTSNSSLSGLWQGGATPKAAAAAAAPAAGLGSCGNIVSLSPAATDCLLALGLCSRVAGVTEACRLAGQSHSRAGSSGGGSGGTSSSCWQVLQLLEGMGAPWLRETVAAAAPDRSADVVCRLVEGADGLPRYKLDEDCIRQLQPTLVVVACDENCGDDLALHHGQQVKPRGAAGSAPGVAPGQQHSSGRSAVGAHASNSSTMTAVVATPGRVRLDPHVVQRVLQRAGVWGEGRAVVLYQRCHRLAEVLEFMQVLAEAAGVPDRGTILVDGLRARLRSAAAAAATRLCHASAALGSRGSSGGHVLASSGSSNSKRSLRRGAAGIGGTADSAASRLGCVDAARGVSVMVLGSTSPLSLAGFWVPEMLQLVGLEPLSLAPAPAEPAVDISWAQLRQSAPDVLVVVLPGLPAPHAAMHLADLASLPGFWSLPAVHAGAVYAVDHTLLLRPGPSLVLGLELLGHLSAPDEQPVPAGLPMGSVLKLGLQGGQRCRPRLVPHYMARYC